MSRWSARRDRFRAVLQGARCIHPASVFDPVSARIAEDLGFEAGMFAGSIASLTVLGAPDIIVLTLSEFAEQAHRICRAGSLPLLCDADHGYGNALNVMRTVEELEAAGVAALSIEDTDLPQPHGTGGKARLLSIEEGTGKMRAAVAARGDTGVMIAGRTSAPGMTGVADAVERARAYEACGVDALFFVGVKTRQDLDAIAAATSLPLILGSVSKDLMDLEYLSSRRVRVCLQGHQPFMAAVQAVQNTLQALRDGTPASQLQGVADDALMKRVMRDADYTGRMKDWLG
ncbi:MAG: isocitrate lyase/PEP mutase family protein [Betaproteobacteria bacterium]|nr:isocitrate lyase/PEP mutase family protein [Betaproteobacteria bacterium]